MTSPEIDPEIQVAELVPSALQVPVPDTQGSVSNGDDFFRSSYDWSKAVQGIGFNEDASPFLMTRSPRITKRTRTHTREVHRQTAAALGLKGRRESDAPFAALLMARASIETTDQGNERPLDGRGSVHRLDVSAAWKAGSRLRDDYIGAGNVYAKDLPYFFLSYGQGGMNTWFFLRSWDMLGDPRMLGDSVIFGLTYARVARKKMKMLSGTIKCPVWDDTGRIRENSYNGKRYRVAARAIDEEGRLACIEEGRKKIGGRRESQRGLEHRCRIKSKKSYKWKVGEYQPDNTVRIDFVDWWELKRAANGEACPAWEGDEYEAMLRARFQKRAARVGLDISKRVRMRDLGQEPEGVNQYTLWMQIWDSTMEALGEEPVNWQNLRDYGFEQIPDFSPSPEKIAEQKALARDPRALEKRWAAGAKKKKKG